MEKLSRSSNFDVSLLVDIAVRESLCFQTPADLLACLRFLSEDPHIQSIRIKNGFALDANIDENGGYRSVIVNIHVKTPEAVLLGIEKITSELQLTIKDYVVNQTRLAHSRYRLFRDLLGN